MTDQSAEQITRPNHLQLVSVDVGSYAGNNFPDDRHMVVFFPEEKGIVELEGNQGTGKTSMLNMMRALMGDIEPENAINSKSKSNRASLVYKIGEEVYMSKITNSTRTLTLSKDNDNKTSKVNKPVEVLRDHFRPLGVYPDFVRTKKSGEDQIAWMKELAGKTSPELAQIETDVKLKREGFFKERTGVNRDVDRLRIEIKATGLYNYDAEQKVFVTSDELIRAVEELAQAPQNEEQIKEEHTTAHANVEKLEKAATRLEALVDSKSRTEASITGIENQIIALQLKLESEKTALKNLNDTIAKGQEFVNEYKDAPEKYLVAKKNLENLSRITLQRKAIEDANKKMAEYKTAEEQQLRLNSSLVEMDKLLAEISKEYTPPIEGLTIETDDTIDGKKPGVYINGINMAHLSESELWDFCLQLWKFSGTKFVFIENSTSLGSCAIDRINWFVKNGGRVFMSTMRREYKELKVSFHETKE